MQRGRSSFAALPVPEGVWLKVFATWGLLNKRGSLVICYSDIPNTVVSSEPMKCRVVSIRIQGDLIDLHGRLYVWS